MNIVQDFRASFFSSMINCNEYVNMSVGFIFKPIILGCRTEKNCVMRAQFIEGPPQTPRYHGAVMFKGIQGSFNLVSMMSRVVSFSGGCTPDRCSFSSLGWL